jgi:aminopeptidase N
LADRRLTAVAVAAVLLLPGCTSFADTLVAEDAAAHDPAPPDGGQPTDPSACPTDRAAPDPDRPVIGLEFTLADDLRTVTGTETVVFTPDVATDELVFRLVPNAPDSAANGSGLTVDAVRGDDVEGSGYERAAAAGPGGLYVVALDRELAAGETTEVELDFTIRLGAGTFDRLGSTDGVSWWASGAPLLAWEPGVGWARDPFVGLIGETATSPAADTAIEVSAPEALTVLMTGEQDEPSAVRDGRRTWTSTEPVARDVAVAAGEFVVEDAETAGGTRVVTGSLEDAGDARALADDTVVAIGELEEFLGPFPYATLSVIGLPDYGGGIEYPSAILQATRSDVVLVHEVAHMWFYGMVGNSQFRDPWLDEAFATWAEAVVHPGSAAEYAPAIGLPEDVGQPMAAWSGAQEYFSTVYGKGGAALLAARDAAGAEAFDAAVRCLVDATAWSVATPDDVATALADLPAALDVLVDAGALDGTN